MKSKTIAILLSGFLMVSCAYAADVTQGFNVTVLSNNHGIEIDNPMNNGIMCYVNPNSVAVGLPIHFNAETLNNKQFKPCQTVDEVTKKIYYAVRMTGKSGFTSKVFAVEANGQSCAFKYIWGSGWNMQCS